MKQEIKELRTDFKECISNIYFMNYDPFSKSFMKAGFIGQMWMLLKMLVEDDDVEEELDGARKYYENFLSSGDVTYKEMAKDELRHAGILIKKHSEWADEEKKKHLEQQETERQEMLKMIEKTNKQME